MSAAAAVATCQKIAPSLLPWAGGVLSALVIQLFVRSFVTRADGLKARLDELCEVVDELARSSHAYWLLDHGHADLIKAEADLSATNDKMNALAGAIFARKAYLKTKLSRDVMELSTAATGDTFQVHNRPPQPHKYRTVQGRATIIAGELRQFQERFWVRLLG